MPASLTKSIRPAAKRVAKPTTKVLDKPRKGTRGLSTAEAAWKVAKGGTAAAANAAIGDEREPATRKAPALLVKLVNKPFTDARNAKPASKPTKATKPSSAATAVEKPAAGPTGAKATIVAMIAAEGGTSAAEVCKALGWVRAGGTIGRAIKLAGFTVAKVRDADGVLRYSRAG